MNISFKKFLDGVMAIIGLPLAYFFLLSVLPLNNPQFLVTQVSFATCCLRIVCPYAQIIAFCYCAVLFPNYDALIWEMQG